MAERGGFEHNPQQSGLQLADSTLPRWLSMPRLPWLLGPYWPMVRIRIPVSYAAVVGLNQPASWPCRAVYPPCCSSIPLLPRAVAATNDSSPSVGPQTNVCGSITASCQLPEHSVPADCLSAHMVAWHEGGSRSAQSLHESGFPETRFASENSKPSADHQSVSAGSSEIDSEPPTFCSGGKGYHCKLLISMRRIESFFGQEHVIRRLL
jgi:hypothetical protein